MSRHLQYLKLTLVFALLCGAMAACKKNKGDSGPRLIKSMTIDGNPCTIDCLYDDQGRVTSVTQCDTAEAYTYYPDSVVYVRTLGGAVRYRDIYMLNADGIATRYTHIAAGLVTDYILDYDAGHHRTRLTNTGSLNTFVDYAIEGGNTVTDSSASTLGSSGNYIIHRIFYKSTENTLSYENFGKAFLGSSSANFKKDESYDSPDGQFTVHYTYELDYLNGVSKRTMKVNDSIIESRDYEYYGGDD